MADIEKKVFCNPFDSYTEALRDTVNEVRQEYDSLPKIHGWVARDKANDLYFFPHDCKPHRTDGIFCSEVSEDILHIDNSMFPEINWQTEPIEVELLIRKV